MMFHADSLASRFPDARTVKTRVDLVDFASQFTRLQRCGRQWVGLCPLHRERRPSFFIHPGRQVFFCHGCQRGGDIFSLVMYRKACSFPDAVRAVASFAHVRGAPAEAKPEVGTATPQASHSHSWDAYVRCEPPMAFIDDLSRDIPPCFFAEIATCADVDAYRRGVGFSFARKQRTNN